MVLKRIQQSIDNHLSEEQCRFRSSRGTTDAVFVVRQLFEKAKERRVPIHWNFVDFKAAVAYMYYGGKHYENASYQLELKSLW